MPESPLSRVLAFTGWLIASLVAVGALSEQPPPAGQGSARSPRKVATYRSARFLVHTDLSAGEARQMLNRLEATLRSSEAYWGRRARRPIECFVAQSPERWPASAFPDPLATIYIGAIGGATFPRRSPSSASRGDARQAIVYANDQPGVAEHEVVHAYCMQSFGRLGPAWYKEGMAELAYFASLEEGAAQPLKEVSAYFRRQPPRPLADVLDNAAYASHLQQSIQAIARRYRDSIRAGRQAPLSAWSKEDAAAVVAARERYRWAWALCHLMSNHANYSDRFRAMGQQYLAGRSNAFEDLFAAAKPQLEFEYRFFLEHFEPGYRVDLCQWDWVASPARFTENRATAVRVEARRGFQATQRIVTAGRQYRYTTRGEWKFGREHAAVTAAGNDAGLGRLTGVVLAGLEFGEPFELGESGVLSPSISGLLYLRCRDHWSALADNQGSIDVHITPLDAASR